MLFLRAAATAHRSFRSFSSQSPSTAVLTSVIVDRIDLQSGGCGVGSILRENGTKLMVHIPRSAPGDTVIVKDFPEKKSKRSGGRRGRRRKRGARDSYVYRAVESIEIPSKHRVTPKCLHFEHCGGCTLQHVSYEQQLSSKEEWIHAEFLKAADTFDISMKLSPPNIEVRSIIGVPSESDTYGYRNKMEFTFSPREFYQRQQQQQQQQQQQKKKKKKAEEGEDKTEECTEEESSLLEIRPVLGLHPSRHTNTTRGRWHDKIVSIDECHLQTNEGNLITQWIVDQVLSKASAFNLPVYDQQTHEGFLKTLVLRTSHNHRDGTPDEIFIEFKTGVPTNEEWTNKLQQLAELLSVEWEGGVVVEEVEEVEEVKEVEEVEEVERRKSIIVGIVTQVDAQARRHHNAKQLTAEEERSMKDGESQEGEEKQQEKQQETRQETRQQQQQQPEESDAAHILYGSSFYHEHVHEARLRVSQGAFFQPNPRQSETLFREAATMCGLKDGTLTLWDLYCGSGTVGIALASNGRAKQLIGIELNQDAVFDAKRNALSNHMDETIASFHAIDLNSKKALSVLQDLQLPAPDVVVVDPPRAGLHPQMIKMLRKLAASSAPLKIVYISCNPATMARDVGMLSEGETKLRPLVLQPVDMLPHTSHLEAICMLSN